MTEAVVNVRNRFRLAHATTVPPAAIERSHVSGRFIIIIIWPPIVRTRGGRGAAPVFLDIVRVTGSINYPVHASFGRIEVHA